MVEINHYHDAKGRHIYDQLIFRDWMKLATGPSHHVRDWRLIKDSINLQIRSVGGRKKITFTDDGGVLRVVIVRSIRETRTLYDPEMKDREFLSQDQRLSYFDEPDARRPYLTEGCE